MTPVHFEQANVTFGPPPDLAESQCGALSAFRGTVETGSVDGVPVIVTAWRPDARELERINAGAPIFLTFLSGGLPPHMATTSFEEATKPA